MTVEQRVTCEIYVPLDEGAPSFEDGIIEQALPDWNKSFREQPGLQGYVSYVTTFSRDFGNAKIQLDITRNNTDGKMAVKVGLRGERLDSSFTIWEAHSLIANPFDKQLSFQGTKGFANEQIRIYNKGLIGSTLAPLRSNVSAHINFVPQPAV